MATHQTHVGSAWGFSPTTVPWISFLPRRQTALRLSRRKILTVSCRRYTKSMRTRSLAVCPNNRGCGFPTFHIPSDDRPFEVLLYFSGTLVNCAAQSSADSWRIDFASAPPVGWLNRFPNTISGRKILFCFSCSAFIDQRATVVPFPPTRDKS